MTSLNLYICGALCVILIITLICKVTKEPPKRSRGRKQIIVEINSGNSSELIKVDSKVIITQLVLIKKSLTKMSSGNLCESLSPQIKVAMKNLTKFIKQNPPENTNAICNMDLAADLVNQQMDLSVNPDSRDVATAYNTVLEHEKTERDINGSSEDLLKYLLLNIDVVIKMLQFDLCENGVLNLEKLYEILEEMNKRICSIGQTHDKSIYPVDFPRYAMSLTRYKEYDNPPNLPLFIQEGPIMEPFQSRMNITRRRNTHAMINNTNQNTKYNSTSDAKFEGFDQPKSLRGTMIVPTDPPMSPKFNALYGMNLENSYNSKHDFQADALAKDPLSWQLPIVLSQFPNTPAPPKNTIRAPPTQQYSIYDKYNVQNAPTPACDNTFEGSVGCDILGYKPPGHIISQLYDKSEHYTVNNNSCASNTSMPRETATCYLEDIAMRNALDGSPEQMLDCIGDCYKEPNYFRWYNKMNTATRDMEFILNPEE
mgnify:FL=1